MSITPEQQAALRAPFPAECIGKLPRITCPACRDAQGKSCGKHQKSKCGVCTQWITSAHMHLDFVGHADATDRLLQVDPEWTWEPVAFDQKGLPARDEQGGMWIRLTVAGVTRLGYGHAEGKKGGDAVKEIIGDAIRNAAMRFGVSLDLWRKEGAPVDSAPAAVEAAAPVDEASQLRNEIAALGQKRGFTLPQIADGFSGQTGQDIRSASVKALRQFKTWLTEHVESEERAA
ncbi:hypothetical protein [Actinoalloteichus sp. GBA129-24]|uniref:hypothetical protein n=1 Tax=Actinoalloteichus sp. GBA129-24 TaxID=1612551 RepID=UPI0009503E17|nr:hypothetical protein [Actinoalloteichus sp. GBA129-24]APU20892.1 hypothetical protein UA75_14410 [Actinoalloteichus sp. GBA129-24]APU24141.1 hypothetical protein UA75_30890 [Actinoalloteichus sp. GBA129-24]